jgi:hypothetical protein
VFQAEEKKKNSSDFALQAVHHLTLIKTNVQSFD